MDTIEIDLGYATLVAEKGYDNDYKEIAVGLKDKNGVWFQDIVVIGGKYSYDEEYNVIQEKGIDVRVYANVDSEDYTHKFEIDICEEDD